MQEKSYQQMRKDFQDAFFKDISKELLVFEDERKKNLFLARIVMVIFTFAGLFFLVKSFPYWGNVGSDEFDTFIQMAITMPICGMIIRHLIKKRFENSVKEECMPTVCKLFGDLKWSSGKDIKINNVDNVFLDSNLLDKFDNCKFDDYFTGSYKYVNFEIVESVFTRGSGKHKETIFDGVIIKLKMNKSFSCNTIIRADSMLHRSPSSSLRHTTLEDIRFEKEYDVFTDDEVEARYLITPTFMERLRKMKTAFFATGARCAFYKQYLFIGLSSSKDLFSICSLTEPVNDPKQFFTMYEEIISIIKLIDHFKLDQKIGL